MYAGRRRVLAHQEKMHHLPMLLGQLVWANDRPRRTGQIGRSAKHLAAGRSADLSLLRYREGFADYQRVLDAQQSLFSQQQRYATNRGDVVRNLIAIYRSLGGGWTGERSFVDDATREEMQQRTNWGELFDSPPE